MAIENTVLAIFDQCSSIVKSVFDCRLSLMLRVNYILYLICSAVTDRHLNVNRDFVVATHINHCNDSGYEKTCCPKDDSGIF